MTARAIRLTRKHLNAYLWTKQGLAKQGPGQQPSPEVLDVARRTLGIHGSAPASYLSLMMRIPNLRFEHLDREILDQRRLLRFDAMGGQPFLIAAEDLPMIHQATRDLPPADFGKILRKMGISDSAYQDIARRVELILGEGEKTASELRAAFEPKPGPLHEAFPFLISRLCIDGRLVRTQARGGWKSDRFAYALMKDWLPDINLSALRRDEARQELARRYFAAHGPATAADFQHWSGLSKKQVEVVLDSLVDELAQVDVLGLRGVYLALENERRALESHKAPAPKGVALLPVRDAYLTAYIARERYLDPEWQDRVVDPDGNATSAVFLNGRIVGIWDFEELEKRLRVKLALVDDLPPAAWKAARQIGVRMTRLIGKKDLILERCPPPRPLSEGRRSPFLAPLKGVSGTPV